MNLPTSPAAERNKQPILEALLGVLGPQGTALEIASGTGEHVVWFAGAMPGWQWQPTEGDERLLPVIDARIRHNGLGNVQAPVLLDVTATPWPLAAHGFDAIFCANMLHISPWASCAALMDGAARHLRPGGRLITYGPYFDDEMPTAPSNLAFDADLKARNPAWGIRRLDAVAREAARAGLALLGRQGMPANNLLLVFGSAEP
ncbi:DUF938 domain-containing protein [Xenophilus arseniciresistens]|uniref:DUF938 domain-containing protein n=1 Tax=Xenophilus arseniciresistens TaxID=1283306 RepID=A0AAE3T037_9BURK|nr:DUF938 domain-containing protein [Xenophilus arseniciresistens]MDA7415897.1 DUF938 domain-containing protein [Xenophilus arseniciresistens]